MSTSDTIIENKNDLIDYIEKAEKKPGEEKIGTEHEKFLYDKKTFKRLSYRADNGIKTLLENLSEKLNWEGIFDKKNIIGLQGPKGSSISLEPGGQFELSGAPLETLHETCKEVDEHLHYIKYQCDQLKLHVFGMGHDPLWMPDHVNWMPKSRYKIMKKYMPKKGTRGLEMMTTTSTVQVNLDYFSEQDMVKKFRTSLALQALSTILFANSPFIEGKNTGNLSERALCWQDTDPDRSGIPACVFEDGFGYERWVDYALDVPMYFVYNEGAYLDVAGADFKKFLEGSLDGYENKKPSLKHWEDHLTVLFPEVRLKKFLEMRGADVGAWSNICALSAFWVGLLYDHEALDASYDMMKHWSYADIIQLSKKAPVAGFKTRIGRFEAYDLCKELLEISRLGLKKRNKRNAIAYDETIFLAPLEEIIEKRETPAEKALRLLKTQYQGNIYDYIRSLSY